MKKLLLIFLAVLVSIPVHTEENVLTDGWDFFGQAHIIPYVDGRDFNNTTYAPAWTTMRMNFGVKKTISDVDFVVNIQDSRLWGQTGLTNHTTGRIGFLEGYIRYNNILNTPLSIQLGSFQMDYGTGRFIGKSPWNFTQRSFDGAILKYKTDKMWIDVFAVNISTPQVQQNLAITPSLYATESTEYEGYDMFGFWYSNTGNKDHKFDFTAFYEDNARRLEVGDLGDTYTAHALQRFTIAGDYFGTFGNFNLTAEAGIQTGQVVNAYNRSDNFEKDIFAYLASIKAQYKANQVQFTVAADLHSGTAYDENEKWNTYDNAIARKHLFMGDMDYFIPIRGGGSYGGVGVNDIYAGVRFFSKDKKWWTDLTAHHFMANAETLSGENVYGQEIDWNSRYTIKKGMFVMYTAAVFLPGEYMKEFWNTPNVNREDMAFASYIRFLVTVN
jgi:hypothetical protein